MQDMNLNRLVDQFRSEDSCRAMLEEIRWPKGVACPRCGSDSISRVKEYHKYDCNACRYNFTVTAGTIFHDTHLPLWKWFAAIYFMLESKKGVSANQLKRSLEVSYKTAWYLCHRIRAAMAKLNAGKLSGSVEADETLVGGKVRGKGQGYKGNKAIVVGVVQRGGSVRLQVVARADRKTLHDFIRKNTKDETAVIYTDDYNERENPYLFRDTLRKMVESGNLEFKQLVADKI